VARPPKTYQIEDLPDKPIFSVAEVVALTGYDRKTVQEACRNGRLKAKKIGKEWNIYRESLLPSIQK
jgi:excisionase family DNA binding protein